MNAIPSDRSCRVTLFNETDQPVDVYVNHFNRPAITDLRPHAGGERFSVRGSRDEPFGTYTFAMRLRGRPTAQVLASTSVQLNAARRYRAILRDLPGRGHTLDVYQRDHGAGTPGRRVDHTGNQPIEIQCPKTELWQGQKRSVTVTARDPDGIVSDIAVASVHPPSLAVGVRLDGFIPASAIGDTATAQVEIDACAAAGQYQATIATNHRSLGQKARSTLHIAVKPITIARLHVLTQVHTDAAAILPGLAGAITRWLERADQALALGDISAACEVIDEARELIDAERHLGIAAPVAQQLLDEMGSFRASLQLD